MSIRATMWALDHAPVKDPGLVLTLWALADEANDDGTDSCPYKDKLIARVRRSERTVQSYLRECYRLRLIDFGDQAVARRRYGKAAGHAPRAWNLNLEATWASVPVPRTNDEMALYARMMSSGSVPDGVQILPPVPDGVQELHPIADQGKQDSGGVQNLHPTKAGSGGVQELHPTRDQGKRKDRRTGGVQPVAPFPRGSNQERENLSPPPTSFVSAAADPGSHPKQEEEINSALDQNQEAWEQVEAAEHWPTLTDFESQVFGACLELDPLWAPRTLRKVLGSRTVREITARMPELTRRAFLLGAKNRTTQTPKRLWFVENCPHWREALSEIKAEAEAQKPRPVPAERHLAAAVKAAEGQDGVSAAEAPPPVVRSPEVAALFAQAGLRFGQAESTPEAAVAAG